MRCRFDVCRPDHVTVLGTLRAQAVISSLPHWVWPCTSQHWIALLRLKTTRKRERPNPATRSIRYVPTTCHVVNRRRPDNRALAAAARRAGLDPRAARVERKTPFARVNAAYRA